MAGRLSLTVGLSDGEVAPVAEALAALAVEGPAGAVFARMAAQLERKRQWRPMRVGDGYVAVAKGGAR